MQVYPGKNLCAGGKNTFMGDQKPKNINIYADKKLVHMSDIVGGHYVNKNISNTTQF